LFIRKGVVLDKAGLAAHCLVVGHVVELNGFEDGNLQFCRARIYNGPNGETFCRDPRRVLGGLLSNYKYPRHKLADYWREILIGESHVSNGVPIVQEFVGKCWRLLSPHFSRNRMEVPIRDLDYMAREYYPKGYCSPKQYNDEHLMSYLTAWDITPEDYIVLLDKIDRFTLCGHVDHVW
jgi:hypothetical protein